MKHFSALLTSSPDWVSAHEDGPDIQSSPQTAVQTMTDCRQNHIFFSGEVTPENCTALIRHLHNADSSFNADDFDRRLTGQTAKFPIWVHINSPGGDPFSALAVVAHMRYLVSPVYTVAQGLCASAATIISMGADKRYIAPGTLMLIHELATIKWGKYSEFLDEMEFLGKTMEALTTFYSDNSYLSYEAVEQLLSHDSWFTDNEAVRAGLVDEILPYQKPVRVMENRTFDFDDLTRQPPKERKRKSKK